MIFNCKDKMRVQKKTKRIRMKLTRGRACKQDLRSSLRLGVLRMYYKLAPSCMAALETRLNRLIKL